MSRYDTFKNFVDNTWFKELQEYGTEPSTLLVDPKVKEGSAYDFKRLDKGCLLYLTGAKHPMRAHIPTPKVIVVCQMKKMIPYAVRSFNGGIFKKLVALLYFKQNWEFYLEFIHSFMRDAFYNDPTKYKKHPDRYNQPVREIYRVLSGWNTVFDKIRDIICAILEFDMAYRYRVQDIIPLLNKEAFYRNPIKEMRRLLDIMISREKDGGQMNAKWKKLRFGLWFLRFYPMLLEDLKKIVKELNLEEFKMTTEDWYWSHSLVYELYDFEGKSFEQRRYEFLKMKYV